MVTLIHGADVVSSRKYLEELRTKYPLDGIQIVASKEIDYSQFPLLFSTLSMFDDKRVVVVEGKLDIKQFGGRSLSTSDVDLIIWIGEKLRANDGLINFVKDNQGRVEFFDEKVDISVFPFLDAVVSKSRKATLAEYVQLKKSGSEPIYLLTMLVWQFRNLIVPENANGFVQKKAREATKNFTFDELRKIYYQLLQLDIQMKTGEGIPGAVLEQFLVKITK